MADGKIYIIVTDQLPGGSGEPQPNGQKDKKEEASLKDFAQHRFFNLVESQARQAINYSINNIGNFTGDYVKQQHIQDAMQVVSFLSDIGVSAIAGAKYGAWGIAIAVGVTVLGKGITTYEQLAAGNNENVRRNREISQLRLRAGVSSTTNGSRGTEY